MKISDRIKGLTGGGSDGWDIFRKSRALVADGVPVIELTIGEHDRRTEPEILDAMYAAMKRGNTGYSAIPGTDTLRDLVAARTLTNSGVKTTRENVVITLGGQAALFAAHAAVCDPGERALFVDPYYATYPGTIRGTGAIAVPVSAKAENGFQLSERDLNDTAPGARSLLVNSPNNPTGVVYSQSTFRGIANVVKEHKLWLISDEVYDSQIWDGDHLSPRQIPEIAEQTLVIGSLSKSHAMTGSRLGWIVGPEEIIEHLINLTTHTTYGIPGFIQEAGEYALSLGPDFEHQIASPFRRRHAKAMHALNRDGMKIVPSKAAMYIMVDIRATGLSGEAFAHHLLDEERIAVMPGESFGQAASGHVRIALTVPEEVLINALETLSRTFHKLKRAAA